MDDPSVGVDGAQEIDPNCGFCGLNYAIHPRYKSLEHLARAVAKDDASHEWIPRSTRTLILKHDPVDGLLNAAQEVWEEWASGHLVADGLESEQETANAAITRLIAAVRAYREAIGEGKE